MSVIESSARELSAPDRPVRSTPSRARYGWAAIVLIVALLAALQWSFAVLRASEAEADGFGREDVPGTLTVDLHPGTWLIYEEAGAAIREVDVTGPDGGAVPVDDVSKGLIDFTDYDRDGRGATAVGVIRLEPGTMGEYRVTVTGDDEFGDGTFAIGSDDVVTFRRNQTAGMLVMLVVMTATSAWIALGTFRGRRS
jgi:hypothetical protein